MRVADHYDVLETLDSDGVSTSYRARDFNSQRIVTITVGQRLPEHSVERFLREIQAFATAEHLNVATVYEAGVSDGRPYVVTEPMSQGSLAHVMASRAPWTFSEKLRLIDQIAAGVEHLHSHGLKHGDLTPDTIGILTNERIKVLPPRLLLLSGENDLDRRNGLGSRIRYRSPESLTGAPPDQLDDIFAIGIIFYELLTYPSEFSSATLKQAIERIGRLESTGAIRGHLSAERAIKSILQKAIANRRSDRYPDLVRMRAHLAAFMSGGISVSVFRGDFLEQEVLLDNRSVRIGRGADNDIVLSDSTVSAHHAEVHYEKGSYFIVDLGSQNGVWINSQRISGRVALQPGTMLQVGAYTLSVTRAEQASTEFLARASARIAVAEDSSLATDCTVALPQAGWPWRSTVEMSVPSSFIAVVCIVLTFSVISFLTGLVGYSGTYFGAGLTFGGALLAYEALLILFAPKG
jgi:serine/threonine protein kinase